MNDTTIRAVVAEDHPVFRDGLVTVLNAAEGIEVVAAVSTGEEAIEHAATTQPDVVIMDLHLPGLNGVEATRTVTATSPHIGVLVLTMYDDDDLVFSAIRAGARGYLLKGAEARDIIRAVRAVNAGEAIFGPGIAVRLADFFSRPAAALTAFPQLTDREREVLDLIAQGFDNSRIADQLFVSPKTVRNHVSNIFTKLQVTDRAQAIVRARDAGLGHYSAPGTASQRTQTPRPPG